ncbi:hypothetical protein CDL12_00712 [Handroanthus impetiginosus]|uniref:Uncharacterized protein n=1 Tax=Handroanthus impetiginosus TaxID=429701 RepID=A0A2G9I9W1_9LAMI|nr:hypothetical protein CDL12_00712 [Handroanthus impetiginosus]
MIYRKWSLLTGPATILAGIVGTVVVADLVFVENGWLRKTDQKKQESAPATK